MSEMNELFYKNPYLTSFDAIVTSCETVKKGYEITLSDTCFYPEGGGQPADLGTLNGISVLDVQRKKDGTIVHLTDTPFETGLTIHGEIDWTHRFSLMQNHSGEHIVSGLIHKKFGYDNVGYHMSDVITLDLSGPLTWDELMEIERETNQVIWDNRPINIIYPSDAEIENLDYRSKKELSGKIRIVEIPDADLCACCGTHVYRTGEIGLVKFLSMINYKGGVRIEMVAGDLALKDYDRKLSSNQVIQRLLCLKPDEIAEGVKKILDESQNKDLKIAAINKKYNELKIASLPNDQEILLDFEDDLNGIELRKFCDSLKNSGKASISAVFCVSDANTDGEPPAISYCIGSSGPDLKKVSKELNTEFNGRGGGSSEMIQGTFYTGRKKLEAEFSTFLKNLLSL